MRTAKNEINPDNIISKKRQRVTSIEGIWSMISSNKIKGVFYSKCEENFLKKLKKTKSRVKPKTQPGKKSFEKQPKKKFLRKSSKKIRRKLIKKTEIERKKDGEQKKNKNFKATNEEIIEKSVNEPIQEKILLEKKQLKNFYNFPIKKNSFDIKGQPMKSIHIVDPKQRENYLRILQEHIGISSSNFKPPIPKNVEFIKIED